MSSRVWAQTPSEVKVGLLVPISGLYARPGAVMRDGAEMGVEHINAQGGIKSLGGAKLKLVDIDIARRVMSRPLTLPDWPELVHLDINGLTAEEAARRIIA